MKREIGYKHFLRTIKGRIASAQVRTVVAANSQMLWLYWQLGDRIFKNQDAAGWGSKVIDLLSADIQKAFPETRGFSAGQRYDRHPLVQGVEKGAGGIYTERHPATHRCFGLSTG